MPIRNVRFGEALAALLLVKHKTVAATHAEIAALALTDRHGLELLVSRQAAAAADSDLNRAQLPANWKLAAGRGFTPCISGDVTKAFALTHPASAKTCLLLAYSFRQKRAAHALSPHTPLDLELLDARIRSDSPSKAAVWSAHWDLLPKCRDNLARRIMSLRRIPPRQLAQIYVPVIQRLVDDGMLGVARMVTEWYRDQATIWGWNWHRQPLSNDLVRLVSGSI